MSIYISSEAFRQLKKIPKLDQIILDKKITNLESKNIKFKKLKNYINI